jgi:DME family drug/metabolite transporter
MLFRAVIVRFRWGSELPVLDTIVVTTAMPATQRVPLVASLVALSAGIVWAMGAVTVKLADQSDAWQYLVWRSTGVLVVMEITSRRRGTGWMTPRAFTQGRWMQLGCFGLFLASITYVYALKNTTEANAVFLASVTPIFAVILARFVLGERLNRVTFGAIALAVCGLMIIVAGDISGGQMAGNIAAMLSSLGFAIYTICVRSDSSRDWSPILPGYAFMMILICGLVTVINGKSLVPGARDIVLAIVHGAVFIVLGTTLFNIGSRSVPAVPMTIFAQTETVFVPIFIFLWFGRSPKPLTLLGGAIIISAVIGKAVLDARPARDGDPDHALGPGPGSIA